MGVSKFNLTLKDMNLEDPLGIFFIIFIFKFIIFISLIYYKIKISKKNKDGAQMTRIWWIADGGWLSHHAENLSLPQEVLW